MEFTKDQLNAIGQAVNRLPVDENGVVVISRDLLADRLANAVAPRTSVDDLAWFRALTA